MGTARTRFDAANAEPDPTRRRLWLLAAVQSIVARPVFLVGGAAVDLYTGSYRPTDIDIVGVISQDDLVALVAAGFVETGTRHLRWDYPDGTYELVEFPESTLDGDFMRIELSSETYVNVISLESLVVDRFHQATDGTPVTFDDAVRLVVATADRVDWPTVSMTITSRPDAEFLGTVAVANAILLAAGEPALATKHFG